jgi:hypothetical protein
MLRVRADRRNVSLTGRSALTRSTYQANIKFGRPGLTPISFGAPGFVLGPKRGYR